MLQLGSPLAPSGLHAVCLLAPQTCAAASLCASRPPFPSPGITSTEYGQLAQRASHGFTPYSATGHLTISVAAGRLSYSFGLKGPSFPVDTVCSSSLVSLHLAVGSLQLGQCPLAVNSAVNLLLTPNTTAMTQKAGMLAADGRCKTLSPSADGYARADTCGAMLLQRLGAYDSELQPARLGAVLGTAVNQDGRSSSLTAPNGPSQQEVVRAALGVGRVPPAAVAGLQMHGTGGLAGLGCGAACLNCHVATCCPCPSKPAT